MCHQDCCRPGDCAGERSVGTSAGAASLPSHLHTSPFEINHRGLTVHYRMTTLCFLQQSPRRLLDCIASPDCQGSKYTWNSSELHCNAAVGKQTWPGLRGLVGGGIGGGVACIVAAGAGRCILARPPRPHHHAATRRPRSFSVHSSEASHLWECEKLPIQSPMTGSALSCQ